MRETLTLQDHISLKYSFKTLNPGQEEVYSVLHRFIEKYPRSDNRLFKYDQGKSTIPPLSERAMRDRLLKVSALRILEQEPQINFARS